MTQFEAFVRKEFFHIFRDTRTLLIIVGMPIVLITLFGFALSLEIRNVNVAIMAKQNDPMINRLADRINRSDCFEVTDVVSSEAAVDSLMRRDVVDAVLMFDSGFSSQLLRDGAKLSVVSDASNPLLAPSEAMYLIQAVNDFFTDEFEGMAQPQAGLTTNVRMLYNPQLKSSYNFVPGVMGLILMIICALMTSVTIVREKESGTMEVLLVSPVRKLTMLVAKMIPYFVIATAVLIIVLILAYTVLKVPLSGGLGLILGISLLYIILSLALGLLVSTFTKTQLSATLICGMVFIVPSMFLSDLVFPIENFPVVFKWMAQIIPAKWYIGAIRKVMIEGVSIMYVWKDIVIMAAMTVVLIGLSFRNYKERL